MSYSLDKQCGRCEMNSSCLDAEIIQGAINTIHMLNNYAAFGVAREFSAHKGSGTVELKCSNFIHRGLNDMANGSKEG